VSDGARGAAGALGEVARELALLGFVMLWCFVGAVVHLLEFWFVVFVLLALGYRVWN
jgi:hypothetical protein